MKPKTLLVKNTDGLDQLIASASKDNFGRVTLGFLSNITPIENFGAYHVANLNQPRPLLSFWSGRISDYWFQRDADLILADADTRVQITELVQSAPDHSVMIDRWHPPEGSNRRAIYDRNGIIERIGVSSKDGHVGLRSFYLRSHTDGWISNDHYAKLCAVLPVVHQLISLRHQIIGTEMRATGERANASRLRNAGSIGFRELSPREAEICDLLLDGKSIIASALELRISESTVRTLRQRAYRKLHVSSAQELMALFVRAASAHKG